MKSRRPSQSGGGYFTESDGTITPADLSQDLFAVAPRSDWRILRDDKRDKFLPSDNLRRAFDNIDAAVLPREAAIMSKQEIVSEILERGLISPELLKQYETLYIGAGTDIEYPLTLGARHLRMLDPELRNSRLVAEVCDRLSRITGQAPSSSGPGRYTFPFDYGEGQEIATVTFDPRAFDPTNGFENFERFVATQPVGLILEYQGPTNVDQDQELMEHLVDGGIVLMNRSLDSLLNRLSEADRQDYILRGHPKPTIELLQRKFAEVGFEFMPLETQDDSYDYTFIKKSAH